MKGKEVKSLSKNKDKIFAFSVNWMCFCINLKKHIVRQIFIQITQFKTNVHTNIIFTLEFTVKRKAKKNLLHLFFI